MPEPLPVVPAPVLGTDQQGAPEANEREAGEGAQFPQFGRRGSFLPPRPQALEESSFPLQNPPSHTSHFPLSPETQSINGPRAHRSQTSRPPDLPCWWVTQVGGAGGRADAPRQGPVEGAGSDLNRCRLGVGVDPALPLAHAQ